MSVCVCVWCAYPFYVALDNAKNGRQYHFHICYSVFTHSQWPHSLSSCAVMWCIYELGDSSESKMLWGVGRGQFCNVCVCVGVSEYCPPAAKGNAASKAQWSNAILLRHIARRETMTDIDLRLVPFPYSQRSSCHFCILRLVRWFACSYAISQWLISTIRWFLRLRFILAFQLYEYVTSTKRQDRNGGPLPTSHYRHWEKCCKKNYIPFGHNRQK